jgi:peptidoglycan/xylan/chitin deacetylase (PgdA/CDA1 family)
MASTSRITTLRVSRALGAFGLARMLTQRRLRILCYHGFALDDEARFDPRLFITPATFDARLRFLRAAGATILPLADALVRLRARTLPPLPVTITIDDGFYGTHAIAMPLLRKYEVPATLYLATDHVENQRPVLNLVLPYLLWRCRRSVVDFSGLGMPAPFDAALGLENATEDLRQRLVRQLVRHVHDEDDPARRHTLLGTIADRLGVDVEDVVRSRKFGFVNHAEVRALHAAGVAIELHTHRHHSPGEEALAMREIADNRAAVERMTGSRPTHFCYPSGRFERWSEGWLVAAGIESATTCVAGLPGHDASVFRLGRFLDGEHISQVEFEAEIAGFMELARRVRAPVRGSSREAVPA